MWLNIGQAGRRVNRSVEYRLGSPGLLAWPCHKRLVDLEKSRLERLLTTAPPQPSLSVRTPRGSPPRPECWGLLVDSDRCPPPTGTRWPNGNPSKRQRLAESGGLEPPLVADQAPACGRRSHSSRPMRPR